MAGVALEITHSVNTQVFLTGIVWKLSSLDTQVWASIPALVFPLLCSWWGETGTCMDESLLYGAYWPGKKQFPFLTADVWVSRCKNFSCFVRRLPLWTFSGLISKAVFNLSAALGCFRVHLHSRRRWEGKSQGKIYSFLAEILLIIRICSLARKIVNQVLSICII